MFNLSEIQKNCASLDREFKWFSYALEARFTAYFTGIKEESNSSLPPDLERDSSLFARLLLRENVSPNARLALCLALAPHVKPRALDLFFNQNNQTGRSYTEFGGVQSNAHPGFLPTGETILFLLSKEGTIEERAALLNALEEELSYFMYVKKSEDTLPRMSGQLIVRKEILDLFVSQSYHNMEFSTDGIVPASNKGWEDLIVAPPVKEELDLIQTWLQLAPAMTELIGDPMYAQAGYRAFFYGPSGTGKTLAASLIVNSVGFELYRVDLSQLVSKYIGETEKNLQALFDHAKRNSWILFFDEADALFGKRTTVSSAHDRYANQEVSYIIGQLESFGGLSIFACHTPYYEESKFLRRCQSVVHFPMPDKEQRYLLWKKTFSGNWPISPDVDWEELASAYELSGGTMVRIRQRAFLLLQSREAKEITHGMLLECIRHELR
ncbi:MAG: ATP-binding protein [Saprospiraceae bacterium]